MGEEGEGRTAAEKNIRIALLTEYDGTDFVGFQRQDNGRSVQQTLEEAVEKVYGRFCRIYGCSRTDSGVHARGHVSHVDVPFSIPEEKIPLALNAVLDDDLVVLAAKEMTGDFHARFNSKGKRYCYRVRNAKVPSAIDRRTEAFVPGILDVEAMDDAAKAFIGTHDFSAFRAQGGPDITPVRTMKDVYVRRAEGDPDLIEITVIGESFLYNMVRIMAGTLVYVGQGKMTKTEIEKLLTGEGVRKEAGKTMPAKGLTLEEVFYDDLTW